jgi:hypothetical protein
LTGISKPLPQVITPSKWKSQTPCTKPSWEISTQPKSQRVSQLEEAWRPISKNNSNKS